ncbi:MAG: flagellar protein FlaG [Synergistaceae bacterium]|jgi:uncharacterized FlaG/YvyC family protein|nr:flagellar protein FlaG [Synergistaceae bacterium]
MGVRFPIKSGYPYASADTSRNVVSKPQTPRPAQTGAEARAAVKGVEFGHDKESRQKMLEHTAGLLAAFDRSLRFDVIEEAGILQIKVLDSRDGSVIRKIPADEVIRMVTHIRKKLLEEANIRA